MKIYAWHWCRRSSSASQQDYRLVIIILSTSSSSSSLHCKRHIVSFVAQTTDPRILSFGTRDTLETMRPRLCSTSDVPDECHDSCRPLAMQDAMPNGLAFSRDLTQVWKFRRTKFLWAYKANSYKVCLLLKLLKTVFQNQPQGIQITSDMPEKLGSNADSKVIVHTWGDMVALLMGQRTCDSHVMGLSPCWTPLHIGLEQATYTCVPLSTSSTIWNRPTERSLWLGT